MGYIVLYTFLLNDTYLLTHLYTDLSISLYLPTYLGLPLNWAGAVVQWLKLRAWKVRDRGFVPSSGIQVSKKKQNVSSCSLVKIQYCGEPL